MLLHDLLLRLRSLMRHSATENELDDELRFTSSDRPDKYVRSGMSEAEAVCHARLEFGGVDGSRMSVARLAVSPLLSQVQDLTSNNREHFLPIPVPIVRGSPPGP